MDPADRVHPADRVLASIDATGSLACVGLDPRPALVPPPLRRAALERHGDTAEAVAGAFVAFNEQILDAVAGHCAAVKPQVACYEAYGAPGWAALAATVAMARARGVPVIVDGKRSDIGSTALHYRQSMFGGAPGLGGALLDGLGGDWTTVNPYLGLDGVAPFLDDEPAAAAETGGGRHGLFVLVRTSNPTAGDVQDLPAGAGSVAEAVAALVARWGAGRVGERGLSDVGAVVGATWPRQAERLRELLPDALFLVPGYGAQGGTAADALAGRRADGSGVLVSSSRAVIGAWQDRDGGAVGPAARAALVAMNAELDAART